MTNWRPLKSNQDTAAPYSAASPIGRAFGLLGRRAAQRDDRLFLDGRPVTPRDLVAAANSSGASIHYPLIRPRPEIYHTGPSRTGYGALCAASQRCDARTHHRPSIGSPQTNDTPPGDDR